MTRPDWYLGSAYIPYAFGAILPAVATLADMQALAVETLAVGGLVLVRSEGALYWYDPYNEDDPDGSAILEPDAGDGRWRLLVYTGSGASARQRTMTDLQPSDYVVGETDDIVRMSGTHSCRLPVAVRGRSVTIHSAGGTITVLPQSGETVMGYASYDVAGPNTSITLVGTETLDWILVG